MRIGEVIGRVTLSRFQPQLRGGRLLIALTMPLSALTEDANDRGEEVVVYDMLGAVDAYCACLIDQLSF